MKLARTFVIVPVVALAIVLTAIPPTVGRSLSGASACIAHRPIYIEGTFEPRYSKGCSGHDEPELDPISTAPGSARDLTWTAILPSDGRTPVSAVGPTFWFGGTVNDSHSLFGQAFVELQFYPDAIVQGCTPGGGFILKAAPNVYSACSPVWKLTATGTKGVYHETAAFNGMLTNGSAPSTPLLMHGGDTITVHWYTTLAADGFHVTVRDLTRGGTGSLVLNSKQDGPLMPAYDRQVVGKGLAWGVVNDTPNSFVWEIGHTSALLSPRGEFCLPGDSECQSYNRASWAGTIPIVIQSVTFGSGGTNATHWAVVSDYGGRAEILANCPSYGGPSCIYPWFSSSSSGIHYGVDFPGTVHDFGRAGQFHPQPMCGGAFGNNSTYCVTKIQP